MNTDSPKARAALKTFEVELLKPHTHADVDYPIGAKINVSEPDRDWLAAQGVIAPAAK